MKRRDFLKAANTAVLSTVLGGLPIRTLARNPLLHLLSLQAANSGRVMVFIQLIGGNDGLNTIIPLDQYGALVHARSNLIIPENKVLVIDNKPATGFHPSMDGLRNMYNEGMMNIVQGVSYPNQSLSHFRSTETWLTASDANQYLNTGWLGRYLNEEYPGYPSVYPNSKTPHPLAIEIGNETSIALIGPKVCMGMAISTVDSFYNIVNNEVQAAPDTKAGHELTFLRFVAQQSQQYTGVLQQAAAKATNKATYPADNPLADQLKIVARLIAGGLQTPVYVVSLGGFDTHATQVDTSDTTQGSHAWLLGKLTAAVTTFFEDCRLLEIDNRVAAMTISEFGRRIKSNASVGTDHGTAGPTMVFGKGVIPGIVGGNPTIPENATFNDNLDMQYDFRSVYASVLADWFDVDKAVMDKVLLQEFEVLPIFRKRTPDYENQLELLSQNYPNPFSRSTTFNFTSQGGLVTILLFGIDGKIARTITNQDYIPGSYSLTIVRDELPTGTYFMRLYNANTEAVKKVVICD